VFFHQDEVFLAVAHGDTNEKSELASSSILNFGKETIIMEDKSVHSGIELEKKSLFLRHLSALFRKRGANFRRDKKAWLCTTILPSIFVLVGFLIFKFAGLNRNYHPLRLSLDDFNRDVDPAQQNSIAFNSPARDFTCQPGRCAYDGPGATLALGESYSFCGFQGMLNVSDKCSINESSLVIRTLDDAKTTSEAILVQTIDEVCHL
jgi:hypothetical protein